MAKRINRFDPKVKKAERAAAKEKKVTELREDYIDAKSKKSKCFYAALQAAIKVLVRKSMQSIKATADVETSSPFDAALTLIRCALAGKLKLSKEQKANLADMAADISYSIK